MITLDIDIAALTATKQRIRAHAPHLEDHEVNAAAVIFVTAEAAGGSAALDIGGVSLCTRPSCSHSTGGA